MAVMLVGPIVACGGAMPPTGEIAFSSSVDGKSSFGDIFVISADRSGKHRLSTRPGPEFDPSWAPDGKRLAYRDSRRGINDNDEIYVMTADGLNPENISRNPANDWSPAWSPDGQWIAFSSERDGLTVWKMRPDGSQQIQLTEESAEYPTWSPDSRRLAFMHNGDIWTVDSDGANESPLTVTVETEGWPAWSPDGSRIAVVVGEEGARTIWIMGQNGSAREQLTEPGHDDMAPTWSPDGRYLAFSRDGMLTLMRSDGGGLETLGVAGSLPTWTSSQSP
jgi:TolB protein